MLETKFIFIIKLQIYLRLNRASGTVSVRPDFLSDGSLITHG